MSLGFQHSVSVPRELREHIELGVHAADRALGIVRVEEPPAADIIERLQTAATGVS